MNSQPNAYMDAYMEILKTVEDLYQVAKSMNCYKKNIDSNTYIKICELKELFICELVTKNFSKSEPVEIIISSKSLDEQIKNQIARCIPIKNMEFSGIYIRCKINPILYSSNSKEDIFGRMIISFRHPNGQEVNMTITKPRNKGENWNGTFTESPNNGKLITTVDEFLNRKIANDNVIRLLNYLKAKNIVFRGLATNSSIDAKIEECIGQLADRYDEIEKENKQTSLLR